MHFYKFKSHVDVNSTMQIHFCHGYKASVVKSQFFGKEYKIRAIVNDFSWYFFNDKPLKIGSIIYLDFDQKDVLEFDSSCSTFFTN